MKAPYPETPALTHYSRVFADWVPCKPWEAEWSGFGDTANGANRYVHRFARHWITADNRRAVTLVLQYESPGTAFRQRPDGETQFVSVIRHRVPDAAAFFADIKIECPKAPNPALNTDAEHSRRAG
jgi:hypothetical protein